jgi:hypothetical protein
MCWSPDGRTIASADALGVLLVRLRDGATLRLREVATRDRTFGLVDDQHGRYGGDAGATSRVVGPSTPPPTLTPDLLARFLE